MKKVILGAILSVFMMPMAHAGKFSGSYKLIDKNGAVLHEGALSLNRVATGANTGLATYREPTANKVVKTYCAFTVEVSRTQARQVVEDCGPESYAQLECVGSNCKGSIQMAGILDGKPQRIVEKNSTSQRIQIITLDQPIDYKGFKNLKSYIHILNKVD